MTAANGLASTWVFAVFDSTRFPGARAMVEHAVAESGKRRFEWSDDCIRARQGQSIAVEADWSIAVPPAVLFLLTRSLAFPSLQSE